MTTTTRTRGTVVTFPLLVAARRASIVLVVGVLPLVLVVLLMRIEARIGLLGFDFKGTIWQPGREILAGHSPYPPPRVDAVDGGNPSVYPPVGLVLTVPFALLPFWVAYLSWAAILIAATLGTLRFLGVRDWRCYPLALASCPVAWGLVFGNLTLLLVPLAAAAWRYRGSVGRCAFAVGLAVALKIILWPLLVWLIATRRTKAAFAAAAWAAGSTLVAWAALGLDGLADYPRLLALNTGLYAPHSWSLVAGGIGIGLPDSLAKLSSSAAGVALLGLSVLVAREPRRDQRAFCLVIVASLALTPIVWPYYFALLLVPIALASATLERVWWVFVAFWVVALVPRALDQSSAPPHGVPAGVWHMHHSPPPTAQIAAFSVLTALVTIGVMWTRPPPTRWSRELSGKTSPQTSAIVLSARSEP